MEKYLYKKDPVFILPGVWAGYFNKTSGALKPGVPARGAVCTGLTKQSEQTLNLPKQ